MARLDFCDEGRGLLKDIIQNDDIDEPAAAGVKIGGRTGPTLRYFIRQPAETHLTPTLFRQILGRIAEPVNKDETVSS